MNLTPEEIRALIAYHSAKLSDKQAGVNHRGHDDVFSARYAKDTAERILQLTKELP